MELSYAIENIRRIKDLPEVELLPITVLVGKNSAGKSTFLRSLPLIRQSIETRSSAPILWFGDLVDFGDMDVAIGESGQRKQAAFRFTIRNLKGRRHRYYPHRYYSHYHTINVSCVSIRYVICERDKKTVLQTIEIKIPDEDIEVHIDRGTENHSSGKITINGMSPIFIPKSYKFKMANNNLFSSPWILYPITDQKEVPFRPIAPINAVLYDALFKALNNRVRRNISKKTIEKEVIKILSINRKMDSDAIETLRKSSSTKTFENIYKNFISQKNSRFKNEILPIQQLARVFDVLDIVEHQLTNYFRGLEYLKPVRAASERFYRKQELEVSRIAPDGSNFPMFLASLSEKDLYNFSEWVKKIFGYGVGVERSGGHISIHLKSEDRSINVTDTGYGVSQILPVLGILWWTEYNSLNSKNLLQHLNMCTLAIEQPELHLHPAHQAKLADAFVAAVAQKNKKNEAPGISLIIETHSEALINRLGELIESGQVSANKVQIIVFSAPEDLASPTEIGVSSFDDSGRLKDWPFGFFNYSEL